MKWWIALLLFAAIGFGLYKHYVAFDPLNLVVLAALIWTQFASMARQQQLADIMMKSQEVLTANQRAILDRVTNVQADVHRLRK